jgi:hypothetical protein
MSSLAMTPSMPTSRWVACLAVVVCHVGLLAVFLATNTEFSKPAVMVNAAMLSVEPAVEISAPILRPALLTPAVHTEISLEVPLLDEPANETDAQNSAPVLASEVPEDERLALARRAGLQAQEQVTVLLRIEVLATGQVGEVVVERTGGTPAIDAASRRFFSFAWAYISARESRGVARAPTRAPRRLFFSRNVTMSDCCPRTTGVMSARYSGSIERMKDLTNSCHSVADRQQIQGLCFRAREA